VSATRSYCVGLTGGIGSGKSTVARLLADHGAGLVDTDLIAHQLTSVSGRAMPALKEAFGLNAIAADGALHREYMRKLAFSDPTAKAKLEAILHPMIREEVGLQLSSVRADYALLVVPLLVESKHYQSLCNRIIVVECPDDIQIRRVVARNGLSEAEVRRIMAAQSSPDARRAIADELVDNSGSLEDLTFLVESLHERLLKLAMVK